MNVMECQKELRCSGLVSRNISVLGHRTSVRLEPEMWQALKDISFRERCSIHALCSLIAQRKRLQSSLTAAVRVFVMLYFRAAATDEGHMRAGHGTLAQLAERLPGVMTPGRGRHKNNTGPANTVVAA